MTDANRQELMLAAHCALADWSCIGRNPVIVYQFSCFMLAFVSRDAELWENAA
jgi:hypothetical protein